MVNMQADLLLARASCPIPIFFLVYFFLVIDKQLSLTLPYTCMGVYICLCVKPLWITKSVFFPKIYLKNTLPIMIYIHTCKHTWKLKSQSWLPSQSIWNFSPGFYSRRNFEEKKKEYYLHELVMFHVWICNHHLFGCVRNTVYSHLN